MLPLLLLPCVYRDNAYGVRTEAKMNAAAAADAVVCCRLVNAHIKISNRIAYAAHTKWRNDSITSLFFYVFKIITAYSHQRCEIIDAGRVKEMDRYPHIIYLIRFLFDHRGRAHTMSSTTTTATEKQNIGVFIAVHFHKWNRSMRGRG